MNKIIDKLLKNKSVVYENLFEYGFNIQEDYYVYKKNICYNQMELTVTIDKNGVMDTKVYDLNEQDYYVLFLVEGVTGSFVGKVREDYENAIKDIVDNCYEKEVYKSDIAKQVVKYVKTKFDRELEFLWEKFDDNAIWRRGDNNKWFGVLLKVSKRKLEYNSDELVEIIDLRVEPNLIDELVDNEKYFKGYHMNKKHWITICLDGSVEFQEICSRIDDSFILANLNKNDKNHHIVCK